MTPLEQLSGRIQACTRCPRLASFVAESRRRYPGYWAKPVNGFGDPQARLFILGLAPGLHGANQHGRVFTGDSSGRWLWGALHELGLSSVPDSTHGDQDVSLSGVYISNAVRCVPPGNRPSTEELNLCRDYLRQELELLPDVRVVLALGRLAHDSYLKHKRERLSYWTFAHGASHRLPGTGVLLRDSYHPSRQNTQTGLLKWDMWMDALAGARADAGLG